MAGNELILSGEGLYIQSLEIFGLFSLFESFGFACSATFFCFSLPLPGS
jgi:hypothetical protein